MRGLFVACQLASIPSRWLSGILTFAIVLPLACGRVSAFEDDTVLCEGYSQESYYQRLSQQSFQQHRMYTEYQKQLAFQASVEQKAIEAEQKAFERIYLARRARFAEAARRREELKAKRKTENSMKGDSMKSVKKPLSPTLGSP